jgi:tRNA nucleotidyltransferase/poly(A) polymerase
MPQVISEIQAHKKSLSTDPSKERVRDEFFKLFQLSRFKPAYLLLNHFGIDQLFFPQKGFEAHIDQSFVQQIEALDQVLGLFEPTENDVNRLKIGLVYTVLKPFLKEIQKTLQTPHSDERTMQDLLYFSLFTSLNSLKEDSENFRLSNAEQLLVKKILSSHQMVSQITVKESPQQHLDIYRFYQHTQQTGFAVIYLAIAEMLVKQSFQPNILEIQTFLEKCRVLLDAWVNHYQEWIDPPMLIDGRLLMRKTGLKPGPKVGEILNSIREAQILSEITSENEAIQLANSLLK